jgi:M6 family metalloprotease-like protein
MTIPPLIATASTVPLLPVGVSFTDYTIQDNSFNWNAKIFGMNSGNLNHYFDEISYGNFALVESNETSGTHNDGIVMVTLPYNHPGNTGMDRTEIADAIALADPFIDFSAYDANGNGVISRDELQIIFIIAGGGTSAGDPVASSVWAHAWSFGGVPAAPVHDGTTLMQYVTDGSYARFGEMHGAHFATIGIIAHELGHALFELPDLYDIDGSSAGIGNFGLISGGSWGAKVTEEAGTTPVHMCAWSKMQQQWAKMVEINASTNNIEVNATHTTDYSVIKVPTDNPQEYFLIENRSPSGYDAGLYRLDYAVFDGGDCTVAHRRWTAPYR